MRLSRTDKVPVLTIVAGGALGFALSLGFLSWTATDRVALDAFVVPAAIICSRSS